MKNRIIKILCILIAVLFVFIPASCLKKDDDSIVIIDGDFSEMKIFTQIARIMIEEHTNYSVKVQDSMASSLAYEQIKNKDMDIYMSYDGSLLTAYLGCDPSDVPDGESVYDYANEKALEKDDVMLLGKLGHQNSYVLAVLPATSEKYHLASISDVALHSSEMTFAAEHEFFDEGSKHYDAFVKFYDINFKSSNTIDRGLKYAAISSENMDVTLVYTTDGLNKKYGLVTLTDDKGFFPEYNASYIARADLYDDYPQLKEVFDELIGKFTNEICTDMNYKVDVEGKDPYDVAYEFLKNAGLI